MGRTLARRHRESTRQTLREPVARRSGDRSFVIALITLELLVFLLHLNTLRRPHVEGDEIVFTFIAEKLRGDLADYSPRGELDGPSARRFIHEVWEPQTNRQFADSPHPSLLESAPDETGRRTRAFDAALYDLPIFTHPPLFAYALTLSRALAGRTGGLLLPVLCHLATIAMVALLGRRLANESVGILAAALLAIDSVSWVVAERVWIDGMMQMMVTASVVAAFWSVRLGGTWRFAVAGGVLGLTGLTKLPAGLILPGVLTIAMLQPTRPAPRQLLAYFLPAAMLVGSWLVLTRLVLGRFFPVGWPTAWMIQHSSWMKHIVERSPLVYVFGLLFVSPVLGYAALALRRIRDSRWLFVPVVWAGAFWAGLMVLGMSGMGFQLRHLSSAIPAVCLMAAVGIQSMRWPWWVLAAALGMFTLMTGLHTALEPGMVDSFPEPMWRYVSELTGWDLLKSGIW